jgi:hypothetical protein
LACTSAKAGGAAAAAEANKRRKYAALEQRFIFVPVAVETSGVWGREGLQFIVELGARMAAVTGEKRSLSFLLQRISIAVQRGNIASSLGTLPAGQELDELFKF